MSNKDTQLHFDASYFVPGKVKTKYLSIINRCKAPGKWMLILKFYFKFVSFHKDSGNLKFGTLSAMKK